MQQRQDHEISVIYDLGNPQASWAPRPAGADRIKATKGDTISFTFTGPDDVTDAVMMTGPRKKQAERSPFDGGNQINIEPGAKYTIDKASGLWGFSLSFTTIDAAGISNFYFLPDPELEVGST